MKIKKKLVCIRLNNEDDTHSKKGNAKFQCQWKEKKGGGH
jgi:hypothetical protein